jgi:hypothetical protein
MSNIAAYSRTSTKSTMRQLVSKILSMMNQSLTTDRNMRKLRIKLRS